MERYGRCPIAVTPTPGLDVVGIPEEAGGGGVDACVAGFEICAQNEESLRVDGAGEVDGGGFTSTRREGEGVR